MVSAHSPCHSGDYGPGIGRLLGLAGKFPVCDAVVPVVEREEGEEGGGSPVRPRGWQNGSLVLYTTVEHVPKITH